MLEDILPACEHWDDCESLGTGLASLALIYLARGEHAKAASAMDRCLKRWQSKTVMLPYDQALWRGIEVYLEVGDGGTAGALLQDLAAIAGHTSTPASRAYLADARAMVAADRRRHEDAVTHFRDAYAHWHEMGCPYQEARTRRRLAESLLHRGDSASRAEAERESSIAHDILRRLGVGEEATRDALPLRS